VKTLTLWSSNGGASGVTSSLKALLSALCRLWGHGMPTLSTLFSHRRLPLSSDPPILPSLHLPRHHSWLLRPLQSGGCFAALLVKVRIGGCFVTSSLSWSCLLVDVLPPLSAWADALPPWFLFSFCGCLATRDLAAASVTVQSWRCGVASCRFGCIGGVGSLSLWVERIVLTVLLAVVYIFVVFSRLCVHFFNVSLYLVLCALVSINLCLVVSRLCM